MSTYPPERTLRGLIKLGVTGSPYIPLQISAAALAGLGWALVSTHWAWSLLGLVMTPVTIVLPHFREKWNTELEDNAALELLSLLRSYYAPLLRKLADIADGPTDDVQGNVAALKTGILNAAQHICGPSGNPEVRAVLFKVESSALVPEAHVGGRRPSKREFRKRRRGEADEAAWQVAETGEAKTYGNLASMAPPGYERGSSKYGTFTTCGVTSPSGTVMGLLNVDSPGAGDLSEVDETIIEMLASSLALGYLIEKRRADGDERTANVQGRT